MNPACPPHCGARGVVSPPTRSRQTDTAVTWTSSAAQPVTPTDPAAALLSAGVSTEPIGAFVANIPLTAPDTDRALLAFRPGVIVTSPLVTAPEGTLPAIPILRTAAAAPPVGVTAPSP